MSETHTIDRTIEDIHEFVLHHGSDEVEAFANDAGANEDEGWMASRQPTSTADGVEVLLEDHEAETMNQTLLFLGQVSVARGQKKATLEIVDDETVRLAGDERKLQVGEIFFLNGFRALRDSGVVSRKWLLHLGYRTEIKDPSRVSNSSHPLGVLLVMTFNTDEDGSWEPLVTVIGEGRAKRMRLNDNVEIVDHRDPIEEHECIGAAVKRLYSIDYIENSEQYLRNHGQQV